MQWYSTVYSRKYPQQVVQHCSPASAQCSDVHFVHIVSKQKQATKLCFSWKCSVGACEDEKCLLISHQPEYYLCTSVICISPCIETSVPLKVKIKYHLDWEVCIQFTSTSKNVKLFKYPFSQFESVLYCPCFKCQIIMFHISKLLISTFICY